LDLGSGFIISFYPEAFTIDIKATLRDSKGALVTLLPNDGSIYIFPKVQLKYNEKYTVSVDYWIQGKETGVNPSKGRSPFASSIKKNYTWSFTTMKDPTQDTSPPVYDDITSPNLSPSSIPD
jgi:hypothetical protein